VRKVVENTRGKVAPVARSPWRGLSDKVACSTTPATRWPVPTTPAARPPVRTTSLRQGLCVQRSSSRCPVCQESQGRKTCRGGSLRQGCLWLEPGGKDPSDTGPPMQGPAFPISRPSEDPATRIARGTSNPCLGNSNLQESANPRSVESATQCRPLVKGASLNRLAPPCLFQVLEFPKRNWR